jgi:hypothetical protein
MLACASLPRGVSGVPVLTKNSQRSAAAKRVGKRTAAASPVTRSITDELESAIRLTGRFTVKEGAENQLSLLYEAGPGPMVFLNLGPRITLIEDAQEFARIVDGGISEVILDFSFSPHAHLGLPQSTLDELLAAPRNDEFVSILIRAKGQEVLADKRINRIVSVVGVNHVPFSIDQMAALARELVSAEFYYRVAKQHGPGFRNRRRKTDQAVKMAKRLKFKLDDMVGSIISEIVPISTFEYYGKELVKQLRGCQKMISTVLHNGILSFEGFLKLSPDINVLRDLHVQKLSAFEWLIGVELTRIFQQHFQIKPTIERTDRDGPPGGSYIRFARQFLVEFDVRKSNGRLYTDEAIARAVTIARSRTARRKNR